MRVTRVLVNPKLYSSNVYFVRGDYNALIDKNTLIDTGADGYIVNHINKIHTGVGKRRIEQVILTHNHFDHSGGIVPIKEKYGVPVFAFSKAPNIDVLLKNKDYIKIGDENALILHVPDHSHDSICILCKESKLAFIGDTPIFKSDNKERFTQQYLFFIEQLVKYEIFTLYPGHGNVLKLTRKMLLKFINGA